MTDTPSNAWVPTQEGESLSGTITEVIRAWNDARTNGGKDMDKGWYPLLRLESDEGAEVDLHCFSAILEARVKEKQPLPGEHVTVTYLGVSDKAPPKGMNAPKLYRLTVDGRDPATEARNVYERLGAEVLAPPPNAVQAPTPELA